MSGYRLDGWGSIPARGILFLFATMPRPVLGSTQPQIVWLLGTFSMQLKCGSVKFNSQVHLLSRLRILGTLLYSPCMLL